jgi:hypothetical protein
LTRRSGGGALGGLSRRAFPTETVRDLIGLARLLYRTWAINREDTRLPTLVAIGKDLQQSLVLAQNSKPDTRQHRQAWELAEVATRKLGYIVDAYVGVKPLITAAFDCVDETAGDGKVAKARRR